nr:GGDEF domain-containing protein [Acidimicrobiia bacterium]
RSTDVVARLGGDEVGVLCPGAGIEEAAALAIELHEAVRECSGPGVTLSVGVAVLAEGDPSPEALLARADEELYRAKLTRDAVWGDRRRWDRPVLGVGS